MWLFSLVLYKSFHWIKHERFSASIIPNTQSFLDSYTTEICQRQKVYSKKISVKAKCVDITTVINNNRWG